MNSLFFVNAYFFVLLVLLLFSSPFIIYFCFKILKDISSQEKRMLENRSKWFKK